MPSGSWSTRSGLTVQHEADGVVVDLVDRFQQLRHVHVGEVVIAAAGDLEVGVLLLPLPLEAEDHVVGIEAAGRLEGLAAVELHVLAQMEGEGQAVRRNLPLLRKIRHDRGAAVFEAGQLAVDRALRIEAGAGVAQHRIEVFRRAFRAIDERLGLGGAQDGRTRERRESDRAGRGDGLFGHAINPFVW